MTFQQTPPTVLVAGGVGGKKKKKERGCEDLIENIFTIHSVDNRETRVELFQ